MTTMTPGARRIALKLIAQSTPPHVARLEASMVRDPALTRFMRDMQLEAGGGEMDGRYSIAEIDKRLEEVARQYPRQYGSTAARIAVKLTLQAAGAIAPVTRAK